MTYPTISRWRISLQATILFAYIAIPFIRLGGNPFFMIDIAGQTVYLASFPVRVEELFIILLLLLFLAAVLLLATALLGRVWCGWLCPQTVVNDMFESVKRAAAGKIIEPVVSHIVALFTGAVLSFATVAYFLAPSEILSRLSAPSLNPGISSLLFILLLLIYLDIIAVGRDFCRSYCPYGRLQAAFMNEGTLNLSFSEFGHIRCIDCKSCLKSCPMGVDIRDGFQIECINCGRCLDACRAVMHGRGGSQGLIIYRFGKHDHGRPVLNWLTGGLLLLSIVLFALLVTSLKMRTEAVLKLQRNSISEPRKVSGEFRLQQWKGVIENRSAATARFNIEIEAVPGKTVELLGQVRDIEVASNGIRIALFFVRYESTVPEGSMVKVRLIKVGKGAVAASELNL